MPSSFARRVAFVLAVIAWVAIGLLVHANWARLMEIHVDRFGSGGTAFLVAELIVAALLFAYIQTQLIDRFLPPEELRADTPEEKRAFAEREAQKALKEGSPKRAIALYENAGMLMSALNLAVETNDRLAAGRVLVKMGKFDKAAAAFEEIEQFDQAGNALMLAGEFDKARAVYRRHAEALAKKGAAPEEQGAAWERAGEPLKAAERFSEAGHLESAAEAWADAGEEEKARVAADKAETIRAYERRKGERELQRVERERRTAAELAAAGGDLYAAARNWCAVGEFAKAGELYRRIGEYNRAARCFDRAGMPDAVAKSLAAKDARPSAPRGATKPKREMKPEPPTAQIGDASGPPRPKPMTLSASRADVAKLNELNIRTPSPLPTPDSFAPSAFIPFHAEKMPATPVFVSSAVPVQATPAVRAEIARLVQARDFRGAAERALGAQDWLAAATFYEQGGDPLKAADLFRQIGQYERSEKLLVGQDKLAAAAMVAMAAGQSDRALGHLLHAVDKSSDPEALVLLIDLYIERRRFYNAMELIAKRIAPTGISQSNADVVYRFARRLEEVRAHREALHLYVEMFNAGAHTEDVTTRVKVLTRLLKSQGVDVAEALTKKKKPKNAMEFLARAMSDTITSETRALADLVKEPETEAPAEEAKPFPFRPKYLPKPAKHRGRGVLAPRREVSLFGVGAAGPSGFEAKHRYEIVRELARGGMGIVYEAMDTALGRPVALKLLQNAEARAEDLQQFLMEARAVARLNHPNVVAMYDIGLMDMRHYLAMELVKGESLKAYAKRTAPMPMVEALRIFIEMAEGLHCAHEAGIVHRDIKPANVLLTEARTVKIVDFGLAKLHGKRPGGDEQQTIFKHAGTPGFMAPEQIEGGPILPAADIYALGIVLFVLLTGRTPHGVLGKANAAEIQLFTLDGRMPSMRELRPEVPEGIEQLLSFCTQRRVAERYQSIPAFLPTIKEWHRATVAAEAP